MRRFKFFILSSIFLFSLSMLYAQNSERIISPARGTWANKQSLIIDVSDGAECYYSLSGTDPLEMGMIYEEPSLINLEGNVTLKVAALVNGTKEEYEINYTVNEENPFKNDSEEKKFIDEIKEKNIIACGGENTISIPKNFLYSLADDTSSFIQGRQISIDDKNALSRYISCIVTDKARNWRFIIHQRGANMNADGTKADSDSVSRKIPFEFTDWETFTFNGKNLIWTLDDGTWSNSTEPVKIDRSEPHTLKWQSVAYENGNPVETFEIPSKPKISAQTKKGSVTFKLNGEKSYKLKIKSSGAKGDFGENKSFFDSVVFDTLEGEQIDSTAVFEIYSQGLFQGTLSQNYSIDRKPPSSPRFTSNQDGNHARGSVKIKIETDSDAEIFYAILGPLSIDASFYTDKNDAPNFTDSIIFRKYTQSSLVLNGKDSAVCYKILAYAKDKNNNVSTTSEYDIVIDEYNYFISANASAYGADGSRYHPFVNFEQALEAINNTNFAHFFVEGKIVLKSGKAEILSNCSFTGINDGRIVIPADSHIKIKDSSAEFQNCIIEKLAPEIGEQNDEKIFELDNAATSFEDCEIFGTFNSNGVGFSAKNSLISVEDSRVTINSRTYACVFSADASQIFAKKGSFNSIAQTAIIFSLSGGILESTDSNCKLISHLGRIAELNSVLVKFNDNGFYAHFDKKIRGATLIWKDSETMILEDKNNTTETHIQGK